MRKLPGRAGKPQETSRKDISLTDKNQPWDGETAPEPPVWNGYVDQYGYHSLAGGWFFAGWVSYGGSFGSLPENPMAWFADGKTLDDASSLFFFRDDVTNGIGYLFFLRAGQIDPSSEFTHLTVLLDDVEKRIFPGAGALFRTESQLVPYLHFILSLGDRSFPRDAMAVLVDGDPDLTAHGYVECFGYHPVIGGWLVSGWIDHGWPDGETPDQALISFEDADTAGGVVSALYRRPDLPDGSHGVVLFIAGPPGSRGRLKSVGLRAGETRFILEPVANVPQLREPEISSRVRANLGGARPGLARDRLTNLLGRRPYGGEDTADALSPDISIYVDDTIQCGGKGLVLMGWALFRPGDVHSIKLRCGAMSVPLDFSSAVRIERYDVLEGFAKHGYDDPKCGFIIFLPGAFPDEERMYLEIETARLDVAYRNVARPRRSGMAAIKHMLGAVDVRFDEISRAYEQVLGPAVEALNRTRLAVPPRVTVNEYGTVPQQPKFSVIVPLYGRLDFVEHQMAQFSLHPDPGSIEFIYVLDDPPKRREALQLFISVFERFQIPFRALLLDRNVGFAPANNIGLAHAHGTYIAYLNSDVFPGSVDWLEALAARLIADPALGVVGPLLLFEDGSVQHRGMYYERLAEFGNWLFCMHTDKGRRYAGTALERFISITGACMVMRRDLANEIGGFDEIYVIGDFEDSDLCLKIRALGFECAIDPAVRLYHLERKSQAAANSWRMNVTAYNAWQHERRWSAIIEDQQSSEFRSRS